MGETKQRPEAAPGEYTLRITGGPRHDAVEVSIDGAEYRPCWFEDGEWRLRWEATLTEPVVAVIRAVR